MGSLILATRDAVLKASTNDLYGEVMTNSFLSGPSPSIESPGPAPYSGVHYDPKNGSILEQFPPEILDKILINLQPIWLFQLELAVPNIALYLTHPASNPVWYETLPATILCAPECFQNENQHLLMGRFVIDYANPADQIAGAHAVTITDPDRIRPSVKLYGRVKNYRNSNFREQSEDIRLPLLDNCSSLAQEASLHPTVDVSHRISTQYPLVKRFHAFRPRNLALGGPYEEHLSYRREVLGYLYTASRCDICLAYSTKYTPVAVRVAGFRLCTDCVAKWTIDLNKESGDVLEYVMDYLCFLQFDDDGWDPDVHLTNEVVLLPLLDHAVRQQLGVDYKTAKAKDAYLGRLRLYSSKETDLGADCRKLRLLIVEAAERLYRSNSPKLGNLGVRIEYWSKAFLPASRLREVLFAPEALDQDALLLPVPSDAKYPTDQVLIQIESAFYAKLALSNPDKIQDMALEMVRDLLRNPNKSTKLVQLATQYHINRLRPTFSVEGLKEARDKISSNPKQNAPFRTPQSLHCTRSINSLLAKLGLEPDNKTQQLQLDVAGKHAAIKTLPRLLESACLLCPASGLLAGRGINRVFDHVRLHHTSLFWGDFSKGSREEYFKLIG